MAHFPHTFRVQMLQLANTTVQCDPDFQPIYMHLFGRRINREYVTNIQKEYKKGDVVMTFKFYQELNELSRETLTREILERFPDLEYEYTNPEGKKVTGSVRSMFYSKMNDYTYIIKAPYDTNVTSRAKL